MIFIKLKTVSNLLTDRKLFKEILSNFENYNYFILVKTYYQNNQKDYFLYINQDGFNFTNSTSFGVTQTLSDLEDQEYFESFEQDEEEDIDPNLDPTKILEEVKKYIDFGDLKSFKVEYNQFNQETKSPIYYYKKKK
jgi:hypothetical protein